MVKPFNKNLGYSAVGACLGVSIYKRFDFRASNGYIKQIGVDANPFYAVRNYLNPVGAPLTSILSLNFKLVNICLLGIFLLVNFLIWAVFGKLTNNELRSLKDKISYTAWEFCIGFLIFYYSTVRNDEIATEGVVVGHELLKYGGLFLCVFLLKCFHYLSVGRVYLNVNNGEHDTRCLKFQYVRFSIGLILLNIIDILLITKYAQEVLSSYYNTSKVLLRDNILISLFGFEILQVFPLIVLTTVKYLLNCVELFKFGVIDVSSLDSSDEEVLNWNESKLKIVYTGEFLVNLIRFGIGCVFSILFMYFYTFPFHILPSSYLTLKLLVLKARRLLNYKKKNIQLQKLITPGTVESSERCIICFDELSQEPYQDIRVLQNCSHQFHFNCLKTWVNYSDSCPICRQEL